jgi:hypothetical protein
VFFRINTLKSFGFWSIGLFLCLICSCSSSKDRFFKISQTAEDSVVSDAEICRLMQSKFDFLNKWESGGNTIFSGTRDGLSVKIAIADGSLIVTDIRA